MYRHAEIDFETWEGDALTVDGLRVAGPFAVRGGEGRPVLDELLADAAAAAGAGGSSADALSSAAAARAVLPRFAARAFRVGGRSPGPNVGAALAAFDGELAAGGSVSAALGEGLRRILVDRRFLLRTEGAGPLTGEEYAARVGFAVTRGLPDAELRRLAGDPAAEPGSEPWRRAIAETLRDGRSDPLIRTLAEDWLQLSRAGDTTPDRDLYPEWDQYVEYCVEQETLAYLADAVRSNRPITAFVDSDYTMANRRLAEYYDLADRPAGSGFVRARFRDGDPRGGVWTQAAVLRLTANGTTTSPIVRGVWVLESLLDQPPPPPDVSAVEPDIRGATTIREQLALHKEGSCAACHAKIDPYGFALESFDPAGRFRTRYRVKTSDESSRRLKFHDGPAVDPGGVLADGSAFADVAELRASLVAGRDDLARSFVHRIVAQASGAAVAFADRAAVEAILDRTRAGGHRMGDLVVEALSSPLVTHR